MEGLSAACNFANMTVTGGEIAELGNRICGYGDKMHFNWCSTAIGVLPEILERPIDGSTIQPGDVVIALQSRGFRSNGFSLLRKTMLANFGEEWHTEAYDENKTWGEALLTPSLIYSPIINTIISEKITPKGVVHITGGGIADNFRRVLKTNKFGAKLDNLFEPLELMQRVIELGKINPEDAYLYWNMGNGMLMVAEEGDVEQILKLAEASGYQARKAGYITESPNIEIDCETVQLKYEY